jgi:hypothetical protein
MVCRGNFLTRLLVFLLAFILGALCMAGTIAGVFYYAYDSLTVKKADEILSKYTNGFEDKILNDENNGSFISTEYGDYSISDFIAFFSDIPNKTVGDILGVSPKLESLFDELIVKLNSTGFITLSEEDIEGSDTVDGLKDYTISTLPNYMSSLLDKLSIAKLMTMFDESFDPETANSLLMTLLYGSDYEIVIDPNTGAKTVV